MSEEINITNKQFIITGDNFLDKIMKDGAILLIISFLGILFLFLLYETMHQSSISK